MRLSCRRCDKSAGRVERDEAGDWSYIGAVKVPPGTYYGDDSKPWHKIPRPLNLSEQPGVTYVRLNCSGGHTIVTDSVTLLTAAQAGQRHMTV
jgi:hypothetical protein